MLSEEIKSKVDQLTPEERQELSIYLSQLKFQQDPEFWKELRTVSDDKDPSRWVDIDDIS